MTTQIEKPGSVIEADVLILGSGASGCGAAIGAVEQGAKTVLVDKGKLESSGCLGGGNDHFMAVLNTDPETDSEAALIDFYKGPGSGYSPAMISRWARAMPVMLDVLLEIGVDLMRNPDGSFLRTVGFGQPGSWFININKGQLIKRLLAAKVRSLGVEVMDHVMVTKLLTENNRITGAVGYDVLEGTLYVFKAKSVVLSLGNSANRASTNSTGNPFNTWHSPFNTGSQFVLGYEAGAKLVNLDLKQLATLVPKGFSSAGMNGINSVGAHELNALGERFMGKYHPMKENGPRIFQIMGTYQELIEGKGPPFHMDMRHCDKEELNHLQYVLMPGDKATFLDYCEQSGIDFAKYPMEVEFSEIELSGMLMTRENFESSVDGLFNGCVFYNFSGSMCSGYIAGTEAASAATETEKMPEPDPADIRAESERIFKPMNAAGGMDYAAFEGAIRQVMKYYMGFVRNEKGMRIALERLDLIENYLERVETSNFHELMRANEAVHLLTMCRLAVAATMERKESGRAIYKRSDYPQRDEAYSKMLALWRAEGAVQTAWI
jgi:succinate dehydrogenase/fumarate reductase flavoprotein subunit